MDSFGVLSVLVNLTNGITPFDFQDFNFSIFNISFHSKQDDEFERAMLMDWLPIDFENGVLRLQLNFSQPLEVSPLSQKQKDEVRIQIANHSPFKFRNRPIEINSTTERCSVEVPKQILAADRNFMGLVLRTSKFVLLTSITSSFILNMFLAASLQQMFGMMNVLQVIVFHTLLSIEFPQNAMLANQMIIQILNVDLLNPNLVHSALGLDFAPEYAFVEHNQRASEIITPQFEEMELETLNPILNLGGIFVVIFGYFVQLLLLLVFRWLFYLLRIRSCPKWYKLGLIKLYRIQQFRARVLKYSHILILLFESVFHLSLAILLHALTFGQRTEVTLSTRIWTEATFFVLCLLLLLLLVTQLKIAIAKQSVLEFKKTRISYGFLWEGIRIESKSSRWFKILFVLWRMAMACILVLFQKWPGNALQLLLLQNLLHLMVAAVQAPFVRKSANKKELANEHLTTITSSLLLLFTDFCPSSET